MTICILYILLVFYMHHPKFIRGVNKEKWTQDKLENYQNDTDNLRQDEIKKSLNSSTESSSSDSKSANQPVGKRKKRSLCELTLAFNQTGNQKALLAEKKDILKSKRGTGSKKSTQDEVENFQNDTEESRHDAIQNIQNTNMESSSSNTKPGNLSIRKRKERLLHEIQYNNYQPHVIDLTENLKKLLAEKESILKSKGDVHKWKDFIILPLPKHRENWNNLCCQLWPGLPNYSGVHKILTRCNAKFHPMQPEGNQKNKGGSYHMGHLHDYACSPEEWSFKADFLSCECKYITHSAGKLGIPQTTKYFFAMQLSKNEYFLLSHVDPAKKLALGLKIIGFKSL